MDLFFNVAFEDVSQSKPPRSQRREGHETKGNSMLIIIFMKIHGRS